MGLAEDFSAAAEEVKGLPSCSNEDQLALYGLFKQANVGDNTTSAAP
jgi:diazepam-binding inhibitor (GABA receptor modulating acyl-CoA-binding protein)